MIGFVIFIHTFVCLLLMSAILMQSGRGGGLTEQFAGAESMFGAKTNVFMVRITTVLATIFLVTCLSLAFLSAKKNQSIISDTVPTKQPVSATTPSSLPVPAASTSTPPPAASPSAAK